MAQTLHLKLPRTLTWQVAILLLVALLRFPSIHGSDVPRIVTIGDLHGDLPRLELLLQLSELADTQIRWTGGDNILVLTGDLMDRGKQVRGVMDVVMKLEKDAPEQGGKVVALFGNHEMMNIIGDLRYVSPETYAEFADEKSEKRRQEAYEKYLDIRRRRARETGQPGSFETPEAKEKWMVNHPLGYVEYREAISRKGKYGRWLRKLPAIEKIGGTIFLHGGIHPSLAKLKLGELNDRIKKEVKNFDFMTDYLISQNLIELFFTFDEMRVAAGARLNQLDPAGKGLGDPGEGLIGRQMADIKILRSFLLDMGGWLSVHPDGPLWFRGFGRWTEDEGTPQITALLQRYGADHFVVGHTITAERDIMQRFGGKVFLVDTVFPSALEIRGNQFTAIYEEGREAPKIAEAVVPQPASSSPEQE